MKHFTVKIPKPSLCKVSSFFVEFVAKNQTKHEALMGKLVGLSVQQTKEQRKARASGDLHLFDRQNTQDTSRY